MASPAFFESKGSRGVFLTYRQLGSKSYSVLVFASAYPRQMRTPRYFWVSPGFQEAHPGPALSLHACPSIWKPCLEKKRFLARPLFAPGSKQAMPSRLPRSAARSLRTDETLWPSSPRPSKRKTQRLGSKYGEQSRKHISWLIQDLKPLLLKVTLENALDLFLLVDGRKLIKRGACGV